MSTNDESKSPDDLLKKYQEQTEENSRDYSKAATSSITSPSEDKQKKRGMAEGIISDLANQRSEIDVIKQAIQVLSSQQNEIAKMMNQQTQVLNQLSQGTTAASPELPAKGLNLDSINALGEIAEKLANVWKTYKGGEVAPSFIDQEYINDQVKKSVMGNFEVGEALISNLKSKLVNKAVASQVSDAMKENSHAPE